MSHFVSGESSPLCSGWQSAHLSLDPSLRSYEACRPLPKAILEAISLWQDRHRNVRFPVESSWQLVQLLKPFTERCAWERAPGEIWPTTGLEADNIANVASATSGGLESMQNQIPQKDRPEAGIVRYGADRRPWLARSVQTKSTLDSRPHSELCYPPLPH